MNPIDAVFLALAVGFIVERPKHWAVVSLAPLLAYGMNLFPMGSLALPLTAIIVCYLCWPLAVVSLILIIPTYSGFNDAIFASVLCATVVTLLDTLNDRPENESFPSQVKGVPIRMIIIGVLYFIFYPLSFL